MFHQAIRTRHKSTLFTWGIHLCLTPHLHLGEASAITGLQSEALPIFNLGKACEIAATSTTKRFAALFERTSEFGYLDTFIWECKRV
jgi:hypothetical protein